MPTKKYFQIAETADPIIITFLFLNWFVALCYIWFVCDKCDMYVVERDLFDQNGDKRSLALDLITMNRVSQLLMFWAGHSSIRSPLLFREETTRTGYGWAENFYYVLKLYVACVFVNRGSADILNWFISFLNQGGITSIDRRLKLIGYLWSVSLDIWRNFGTDC